MASLIHLPRTAYIALCGAADPYLTCPDAGCEAHQNAATCGTCLAHSARVILIAQHLARDAAARFRLSSIKSA